MNVEQVLQSIALKKRFCKNNSIPISVFDNPYFYQRLCALEPIYHGISKFTTFCEELEKFHTDQEYLAYYNSVKDSAIEAIKRTEPFLKFCQSAFDISSPYHKRNVYIEDNNKKAFISIDMRNANFSALSHYDTSIFNSCETWEEFIGQFTDCEHIIQSKYIRQVIMGACNPSRQIRYEQHLMTKLILHITANLDVSVFSLGEDEIILAVDPDHNFNLGTLRKVINNCPNNIGSLVRVEMFNLEKIPGTDGWIKFYYDDRVEFKCLDGDTIHQVIKWFFGEPITKDDLVFFHNGKLATYLEAIENPWKS